MTHTVTISAEILLPADAQNLTTVLDFDTSAKAYITNKATGALVTDSDGNPVLVFFDKSTGQAYARIATYNPNDGSADAVAIQTQGGLPNFKGLPEHYGYFVPIAGLFVPVAGSHMLNGEGVGALAAYTAANSSAGAGTQVSGPGKSSSAEDLVGAEI